MKKILHIINGEFFAGAERVQDLLALRLPEFGYECGFVCLKDGVFAKSRRSIVPLHVISMQSKLDVSVVSRVSKIAIDGGYSAIHTHTVRSALIGKLVATRTKLPLVHHVHSPASRDTESKLRNYPNTMVEKYLIFKSAKKLIAVSSCVEQYLLALGVDSKKIAVVPNGVPIIRDYPVWTEPSAKWTIGVVALFRPRKGINILLKAIRQIIDSGVAVCLRGVGAFETPEYESQIKQLVIDLKLQEYVHWTGFTSDVHKEMESMHIFVLPSLLGEGLPMVVIEAMSVGIPVVASDVEGIPEVISSLDYGVVVPPNDVNALSKGIQQLIKNHFSIPKLVVSAHRRQGEFFSDVSMARKLAVVYDEIFTNT